MYTRKIASYFTIALGVLIVLIVFFLNRKVFGFTTDFDRTLFESVMDDIFEQGFSYFLWWVFFISFIYSWWSLRNKITDLLLKFHKKV